MKREHHKNFGQADRHMHLRIYTLTHVHKDMIEEPTVSSLTSILKMQ